MRNTGSKTGKTNVRESKPTVFTVTENALLMDFLIGKLPHKSRDNIKSLLRNRQVLVNGEPEKQFNLALSAGQTVEISSERVFSEKKFREYTIVFEDDHLIVIDKQAGLLTMGTGKESEITAYNLLSSHVKKQNRSNKIFIVHRLDRETSGLLLFAKNEKVKKQLQENWNDTVTDRTYLAIVEGDVQQPEGTIISYLSEDKVYKMHSSQNPSKGQKAVTHYSVLKKNKGYSLLKVNLETGRKNQIRIHMQELGHSVAGDKKYGAVSNPLRRLGLHAQQLSFIHPVTQRKMDFNTNIPRVFQRLF